MSGLTVFTFSADWGLPTTGPFALKLLKWLELAGIPFHQQFEDNTAKGPKGKNPWIELDGERYRGEERLLVDRLPYIRDVRQGPDGLLYLVTHADDGGLFRIEPA